MPVSIGIRGGNRQDPVKAIDDNMSASQARKVISDLAGAVRNGNGVALKGKWKLIRTTDGAQDMSFKRVRWFNLFTRLQGGKMQISNDALLAISRKAGLEHTAAHADLAKYLGDRAGRGASRGLAPLVARLKTAAETEVPGEMRNTAVPSVAAASDPEAELDGLFEAILKVPNISVQAGMGVDPAATLQRIAGKREDLQALAGERDRLAEAGGVSEPLDRLLAQQMASNWREYFSAQRELRDQVTLIQSLMPSNIAPRPDEARERIGLDRSRLALALEHQVPADDLPARFQDEAANVARGIDEMRAHIERCATTLARVDNERNEVMVEQALRDFGMPDLSATRLQNDRGAFRQDLSAARLQLAGIEQSRKPLGEGAGYDATARGGRNDTAVRELKSRLDAAQARYLAGASTLERIDEESDEGDSRPGSREL